MTTHRPGQRAALVSGLTELARFLEANPDLPLPVVPELRVTGVYRRADHAASDVAHVAGLLGADPHHPTEVRRWFGQPGGLLYTFSAVLTVPATRACTRTPYQR